MKVVVAGPGLMGSQIGVEYALGGHQVAFLVNRHMEALRRVAAAFETALAMGIWSPAEIEAAEKRVQFAESLAELPADANLIVESVAEDLAIKGDVLRPLADRYPEATIASNTSSISIGSIGEAAGAPERTIGVHYWNPPLLMPLVEVIAGPRTLPDRVTEMLDLLQAMHKRPVQVDRDVPGFAWNRLQMALLREAIWLVENGVATPEAVDQIVREGLARRWEKTGPFATAALGGPATFTKVANNLLPVLSAADHLDNLGHWLIDDPDQLAKIKANRDAALLADLKSDLESGR